MLKRIFSVSAIFTEITKYLPIVIVHGLGVRGMRMETQWPFVSKSWREHARTATLPMVIQIVFPDGKARVMTASHGTVEMNQRRLLEKWTPVKFQSLTFDIIHGPGSDKRIVYSDYFNGGGWLDAFYGVVCTGRTVPKIIDMTTDVTHVSLERLMVQYARSLSGLFLYATIRMPAFHQSPDAIVRWEFWNPKRCVINGVTPVECFNRCENWTFVHDSRRCSPDCKTVHTDRPICHGCDQGMNRTLVFDPCVYMCFISDPVGRSGSPLPTIVLAKSEPIGSGPVEPFISLSLF